MLISSQTGSQEIIHEIHLRARTCAIERATNAQRAIVLVLEGKFGLALPASRTEREQVARVHSCLQLAKERIDSENSALSPSPRPYQGTLPSSCWFALMTHFRDPLHAAQPFEDVSADKVATQRWKRD